MAGNILNVTNSQITSQLKELFFYTLSNNLYCWYSKNPRYIFDGENCDIEKLGRNLVPKVVHLTKVETLIKKLEYLVKDRNFDQKSNIW